MAHMMDMLKKPTAQEAPAGIVVAKMLVTNAAVLGLVRFVKRPSLKHGKRSCAGTERINGPEIWNASSKTEKKVSHSLRRMDDTVNRPRRGL